MCFVPARPASQNTDSDYRLWPNLRLQASSYLGLGAWLGVTTRACLNSHSLHVHFSHSPTRVTPHGLAPNAAHCYCYSCLSSTTPTSTYLYVPTAYSLISILPLLMYSYAEHACSCPWSFVGLLVGLLWVGVSGCACEHYPSAELFVFVSLQSTTTILMRYKSYALIGNDFLHMLIMFFFYGLQGLDGLYPVRYRSIARTVGVLLHPSRDCWSSRSQSVEASPSENCTRN
jgi:hypothetical protein